MTLPLRTDWHQQENINIRNHDFCMDTLDLFCHRRSGHLSKWLYSSAQFQGDKARGADVRERVIEEARNGSAYYVFIEESAVIQQALKVLPTLIDRPARLIDLGPGSLDAVEEKIFPILKSNPGIVNYVGVDVCNQTLDDAAAAVKSRFKIQTQTLSKNFIQDEFTYGRPVPMEVATLFGQTAFNIEIDPRTEGLPQRELQHYLSRIRSHFSSEQKYLIITQDTNQDVESLRAAYLAISDYFLCLPHRMQRDLYIEGNFNPDNFTIGIDYFPETQALSTCLVASEPMSFSIEGQNCSIAKGERFYFNNAYKFNIPTFLQAASEAGFETINTIQIPDNSCALHILKSK